MQSLQVKYRPTDYESVVGQEHITNILRGLRNNGGYKFSNAIIFYGTAGGGKALANDEPVLTNKGWKPISELTLTDLVIGTDGRAHRLNGIYPQGKKKCYKITFRDNTYSICSEDHLWYIASNRTVEWRFRYSGYIKTVSQMLETGYKITKSDERSANSEQHEYLYGIPILRRPVNYDTTDSDPLRIHPYVLGVLLGDGGLTQGSSIGITLTPRVDLKMFLDNLPEGCILSKMPEPGFKSLDTKIVQSENRNRSSFISYKNKMKEALEYYNLYMKKSEDKHIPKEFLMASISDRKLLLKGLLDTDGSKGDTIHSISEFSTSSKQLAEDFLELARSLGLYLKYNIKTNVSYVNKNGERVKCLDSYRIESFDRPKAKSIIDIEEVGYLDCTCISVNSLDSLFITRGFNITHNTTNARIYAKSINCLAPVNGEACNKCENCVEFNKGAYPDFIEIDGASYGKVEDARKLIEIFNQYTLNPNGYRVILIDECHRLSKQAWDIFLKPLEEGQTKTIFLFATTEFDKIPPAIISRSIVCQIKSASSEQIKHQLIKICKAEGIEYDEKIINKMSYIFKGKMRDSIKTLDMYYKANGNLLSANLENTEERVLEVIQNAVFNKMKEAYSILDELFIDGSFYTILNSVFSTILLYPTILDNNTSITEAKLKEFSMLVSRDTIRNICKDFAEYKPKTIPEFKMFCAIICEQSQKTNGTAVSNSGDSVSAKAIRKGRNFVATMQAKDTKESKPGVTVNVSPNWTLK